MSKLKKKPGRFNDRNQILARIDKFTGKANAKQEQVLQCFKEYREKLDKANTPGTKYQEASRLILDANRVRDKMNKHQKSVNRYRQVVLPRLKHKLSEFDTAVIPGVTDDKSVEADV